jgi:hypothetical protein
MGPRANVITPGPLQGHGESGRYPFQSWLMIEEKSHDTEEVSAQMSFLFANRL